MKDATLAFLDQVCTNLVSVATAIREETDALAGSGNHVDIIKHFNQVRLAAERIKESREAIKDMEDSLSTVIIPDVVQKVREVTGEKPPFNIEGVGRVTVSYRFSCSMPDKNTGIDWLKNNGHGGIVQETVNSSTLSAFAKNMLEESGIELPPEIFKVGTKPYTSITKAK
jgi:hypothetical protein